MKSAAEAGIVSNGDLARKVANSVDSLLSYVDSECRYRFANRAYEHWFGFSPDRVVGRTMQEVLGDGAFERLRPYVERALAGQRVEFEIEAPYRTGGAKYIRAVYSPDVESGAVQGFIAHVTDITAEKHAEAAMREVEARFRLMADSAPALIWIADPSNRGVWFNKPWLDFVGRTMEQEIGYGWAEGVHPDDVQRCVATCSGAIDLRRPFTMEFRMRRHDGEYRWVLDTGVPFYGGEGELLGYIGSCIDITEKRLAEEQLRRINETLEERVSQRTRELEQANRELESFSYSVSHDLRAPLRSINAHSRMLVEDLGEQLTSEACHKLDRIAASATRMAQLIDDLLYYARLGRMEVCRRGVDLSDLADAIVQELRANDPEREVQVQIEEGVCVVADPDLMRPVMQNLLANAWKFTSKRSDARIEIGRNGHGEVYVRDNGVGFDMQYATRLFSPFERLHGEDYSGTGIGLANVRRIIERHGGKVRAESAPGAGATFYFSV